MENALSAVTIVEHNHLSEMHASLRRKLQDSQKKDQARMDSIRSTVLGSVVGENYDRARTELEDYVLSRTSFPGFQDRAQRYADHCSELIHAIKMKRNFPGLAALSLAKQQEVHEKVIQHFEELKHNLKLIERVEREHRLNDLRSTVWVVRTAAQVAVGIVAMAFMIDLRAGMFSSAITVIDVALDGTTTWFVNLFGF